METIVRKHPTDISSQIDVSPTPIRRKPQNDKNRTSNGKSQPYDGIQTVSHDTSVASGKYSFPKLQYNRENPSDNTPNDPPQTMDGMNSAQPANSDTLVTKDEGIVESSPFVVPVQDVDQQP